LKKKYKHISFDLDGTLIDSFKYMEVAWELVNKELDLKVGFEKFKKYVGLPFPIILKNLSLSDLESEISSKYFDETKKNSNNINLIENVQEIIKWLKNKEFTISVITSKPRLNSERLMELKKIDIDELICGDDFSYGKPNPIIINNLCKKMKIKNKDFLYIGDMIFDLQFAQNAEVDFLHFSNNDKNMLPKNLINPVKTVNKLVDLKKLLIN